MFSGRFSWGSKRRGKASPPIKLAATINLLIPYFKVNGDVRLTNLGMQLD
jgi:hypothetical protein